MSVMRVYNNNKRIEVDNKSVMSPDYSTFLFENLTVGLYRTTADGKILIANPALVKMLGFDSFKQLQQQNTGEGEFGSGNLKAKFKNQFIKTEELKGYRTVWMKKDGSGIHVIENSQAVKSEAGEVLYYEGTVEDITNWKNDRNGLRDNEAEYSILFKKVQDLFYKVDIDGIVIDISTSIKQLMDFDRDDIIGKPVTSFYYNPEDRMRLLEEINSNGEVRDYEVKLKTSSGKAKYASISARLICDSEGNPDHYVGSIKDIDERVRTELELRMLKQAIEQSSVSILITDIDGNIEYVNSHFVKQTGYTLDDVKGLNPRILRSSYHDDDFYKELWETILAGKDWQGEMLNKKKNDELYWANVVISPISNNGAKITHFVAIQDDITEKKLMLEELVDAKQKAEEANKLKSNFLANMSHELRTPLVGILGYAELLSEEIANPDYRDMSLNILHSGRRLMETLNSILDISRIESNKQNIKIQPVNLLRILHESANLFRNAALQKDLSLDFSLPENPVCLNSDEDLLFKIFNNLISNAVKYTHKGGIMIKVSDCVTSENIVKVDVIDTGIGISREYHNIVFEPFRQVSEGHSRSFEGTGLGLSITKKIVELLGGSITFKSDPGAGSVFSVTIPLPVPEINIIKKDEDNNLNSDFSFNNLSKSHSVLLVEDDMSNAIMTITYLEEYVSVDHVLNGFEAIDKCKLKKYDAILMDINLKGIDGVKTLSLVRALDEYYSTIPVIAVTAYAMKGDKEKFLSLGFDRYLSKPFERVQLLNLLSSVIAKDKE